MSSRGHAMNRSSWIMSVMVLLSIGGVNGARCQERVDRFGDALPEHAVARMGSLRFQAGFDVARTVFSEDGKKLLATGFFAGVRAWDAETGKEFKLAESM